MSASALPHAVVLGLADTGYGVVRSLAGHGIPIVAFEKNLGRSEARTRLCEVRGFEDDDELLRELIHLGQSIRSPPVLYPTSDAMVSFFSSNRDTLKNLYRIDYPSSATVDLLLKKGKFCRFASEHGFATPQTFVINTRAEFDQIAQHVTLPCVVKPYYRKKAWHAAKFPKVFRFSTREKLTAAIGGILAVERDLIVQEWIPGPDSSVYFCLTYFNQRSECLSHFTGRKLRQWPVGTGSTACAEPISEDYVTSETIRLFETVDFRGFGSVEFKRHADTDRLYITEPTVGRSNHQSYLATANGTNLQLTAYTDLTAVRFAPEPRSAKPVVWIDDQFDPFSVLVSLIRGKLEVGNLIRSYLGRKSFRFLNRRDPRPFLHAMFWRGPLIMLQRIGRHLNGPTG